MADDNDDVENKKKKRHKFKQPPGVLTARSRLSFEMYIYSFSFAYLKSSVQLESTTEESLWKQLYSFRQVNSQLIKREKKKKKEKREECLWKVPNCVKVLYMVASSYFYQKLKESTVPKDTGKYLISRGKCSFAPSDTNLH